MVFETLAALAFSRGGRGRSNSRPGRTLAEWEAMGFDSTQYQDAGGARNPNNPYDPRYNLDSIGIYDDRGDVRGLPGYHIAPDVQLGHEIAVGRFNDRLAARAGQQAQAALQSGIANLQAYRPGGAAAMLSGLYQGRAQAAFTTAQMRRREPLNLMFRYDERVRKSAERQTKTAGIINTIGSLVGTVAGAAIGGGAIGIRPNINIGAGSSGAPGSEAESLSAGPTGQSIGDPGPDGFIGPMPGPTGGGGEFMGPESRSALQDALMRVSSGPGGGAPGPGGGGGAPRKSMAPGAGGGPGPGPQGAPGGGPAPAPGPGGGPPPQGQPAPPGMGAAPPAPSAASLYGPVTADVSAATGIDPGLLLAMVRAGQRESNWIDDAHAALDALNMRDAEFLAAIS